MALSIVVAFVVTCILHKRNVESKESLAAPMKGTVASITECPDPTFASKAMISLRQKYEMKITDSKLSSKYDSIYNK